MGIWGAADTDTVIIGGHGGYAESIFPTTLHTPSSTTVGGGGHSAHTQATAGANVAGQSGESAAERRVTELVNQIRARYGMGPLSFNAALDQAAEGHNQVMIGTRTMAHSGIGDGTPGDRVRATGYRGSWGENVAVGQTSAEQVVKEWMDSPTHRANILNPSFTRLSVAQGTTADGLNFWAQAFGG